MSSEQNNESVKRLWEDRDRVTRAISQDGMFRAAVVHNTKSVLTAQNNHALDPMRAMILARALTGATLMATFLKGEERVVLQATGDGLVSTVYAEALQVGEVRGFISLNANPVPNRASPLGEGLMKVQRILYNKYEPVTGIVELRKGDITTDLGYYLTQSEQIPSAFVIDVAFDEHDRIRQSVGLLIQAMPGARPEDIFKVYDTIDYLERLTEFADKRYSPDEILRQVLPGESQIVSSSPVDFFCRCSLDRFKSLLQTIGLEEVRAMERDGQNELVCQYCATKYYLSAADFEEIKNNLLVKRN